MVLSMDDILYAMQSWTRSIAMDHDSLLCQDIHLLSLPFLIPEDELVTLCSDCVIEHRWPL